MKRYLKFNNVAIAYVMKGETPYLPVKTMCEVLGIDYVTQFKATKNHPIFGAQLCLTPMETPAGMRKTACLPLKYALAWLLQINPNRVGESVKGDLISLQEELYNAVYAYFYGEGMETQRRKTEQIALIDREITLIDREINSLQRRKRALKASLQTLTAGRRNIPYVLDNYAPINLDTLNEPEKQSA